ncbi:MAG: hypothetical protein M1442_04600 [Candidatus Thermoplasmatota archaeon]|nr:hypothetical protein [Candidatus Thermoplasmatota archaeon]
MTLIIGAQGVDGSILCSDRAEHNDTFSKFTEKLYVVNNEIAGYAGAVSVGEKIIDELRCCEWPENLSEKIQLVELIVRNKNKLYTTRRTENETSLFISLHDDNDKPLIQCVDYNGTSFRIRGYESIGSGDSEAEYFLRTLYRHEYDVEKLAEICSFVIQLISESAINNSVRVSSEYPPECYIIQHSKPYRYENPYLYDINHNRILSLHHNLNNLFTEKDILVSEAIKRYY